MGFEPLLGSEFEFYLLTADTHEPLFSGYHIFNTLRNDYVPTIRRILDEMPQVGVDIITSNCEYAGSQWEINFAPGRGLAGPDNAFTFKNGVKEIAKQDGYLATFMTKPWADSAGSGCHTHISLLHTDSGENAFGDADDPQGMTDACRSFIAGQLRYARTVDSGGSRRSLAARSRFGQRTTRDRGATWTRRRRAEFGAARCHGHGKERRQRPVPRGRQRYRRVVFHECADSGQL